MKRAKPIPEVSLWLVDGYNYLHALLLGGKKVDEWWSAEFRARVLEDLETKLHALNSAVPTEVRLLFDGGSTADMGSGIRPALSVEFHSDADAAIVDACDTAKKRGISVLVVTADRALGDRCRARGASILKPWHLQTPQEH